MWWVPEDETPSAAPSLGVSVIFAHITLMCQSQLSPHPLHAPERLSESQIWTTYAHLRRQYSTTPKSFTRQIISGFLDLVGILNWIMLKITIITILMIENSSCFSILPSLKTGIAHSSHSVIPAGRWQWLGGRLCPHRCLGRKENSLKSFHSGKTRSGWVLVWLKTHNDYRYTASEKQLMSHISIILNSAHVKFDLWKR